ncbi:MAG: RNA-binding protein [Psychrobium sp.]|nr:RNA-binding protein [Psychrobium sp.]
MKSTKFTSLLITLVLALVGYFLLPVISESMASSASVLAIGIIIGGVVVTLLAPSSSSVATDEEDRQTLYVGNLPYRANESIVRELFETFGSVYSVRLVKDKQTGRRRGFGFVTMNAQGANDAMAKLNDQEFQERVLKVREAKEKTSQEQTSQAAE